jgi:hypothetical protein
VWSALQTAAQFFESRFTDNVTINIAVGWGEVAGNSTYLQSGLGTAGETSLFYSTQFYYTTYATLVNYLARDARSADDVTAVNNLLNTPDPTYGGTIAVPLAEAKALGLPFSPSTYDAYIGFNPSPGGYQWSYNADQSVPYNYVDFIGVAEHEISHALGREAGPGTQYY